MKAKTFHAFALCSQEQACLLLESDERWVHSTEMIKFARKSLHGELKPHCSVFLWTLCLYWKTGSFYIWSNILFRHRVTAFHCVQFYYLIQFNPSIPVNEPLAVVSILLHICCYYLGFVTFETSHFVPHSDIFCLKLTQCSRQELAKVWFDTLHLDFQQQTFVWWNCLYMPQDVINYFS